MIKYKLNKTGDFAQQFIDGIATGAWFNTGTNQTYLNWISEGNTPLPADEPVVEEPAPVVEPTPVVETQVTEIKDT